MSPLELKNYFRDQLQRLRTIAQEYNVLDAIVDFITQAITDGIPAWTALLTFNTDGTGAGAFCLYPDTNGKLRFWITKIDGNINHAPPNDPLVDENTQWKEVSPSSGSAVKEWAVGFFGVGLVIVYYDVNGDGTGMDLFKLTAATRPFHSTDFFAELAAGTWEKIGGPVGNVLDTSAAPLVLDLKHNKEAIFVASAAIGVAKTWTLENKTLGQKITILFSISAAADQDFSTDAFKMEKISGDWNSGTKKWTPPDVGDYEAIATWNGTNWLMKINGPF
jgi:hypothetical protein